MVMMEEPLPKGLVPVKAANHEPVASHTGVAAALAWLAVTPTSVAAGSAQQAANTSTARQKDNPGTVLFISRPFQPADRDEAVSHGGLPPLSPPARR